MSKNIAVDVGFGFVKATDGNKEVIFPSVVGEGREIRYKPGVTINNDAIKNLFAEVDGEKYFVGDLATRQSEFLQSTLSGDRTNSIEYDVLFKTACALLNNGSTEVNIVTGLPVNEFTQYKNTLEKMLLRIHKIKLNDISYSFEIKRAKIIPQPFGTVFNLLLDDQGEIQKREYVNMKIGVIDIGFRTTDFIVVDCLEFVDKLSSSTTVALSSAYKLVGHSLNERFGINKPIYQLDKFIRTGFIPYKGQQMDIRELVGKAFALTTNNIISEVSSLWNIWELDQIIITGGGGVELYAYLKAHIDNCVLVNEGQFSNVKGYLKLANRSFR
ncbi:hypothetical protein BBF96_03330 [Anoxybacter fermentans]|uniref:Uncharacterized protein n=1 Tax=Anoxybacter fermentans TaxID=1323375 RepID=A0A3Q9HP51_9FIRM|nr:ParM/StbA family protein [Anoxybacter fermentans]AZR72497.1 hypothetical protein BBF96_03330 [Anoxybacter fermentans]